MKKLILALAISSLAAAPALACPDHESDKTKTAEKSKDNDKSQDQAKAKEQPKKQGQDKAKAEAPKNDTKKPDKVSQK
jgi:Ni/Co efflux regulator RcnB